ncbi:MAG: ABC transporter ATP-binding protein [Planctomycetota bacterium]
MNPSTEPPRSDEHAAIHVDRVTKRFGRTTAVDDASIRVPAGCVYALLGENGAGKTTLLRMMLGLETPTDGRVTVLGRCPQRDGDGVRQRVGYVPERPTLYEWMTAAEIGWFTAGFYADGFERRYRDLIDRFRVPASRKVKQMSKGMRAKVALALAMGHAPDLLVLDEPTSGLDTLVRREFLENMVDLAAEGHTVLLSSHLIGEVERVADRVAIVRSGRVLAEETLDRLKGTSRQVTLTMQGAAAALPALPGAVLGSRRRGVQWEATVRGVEDAESLRSLAEAPAVVSVETRTPTLEELFVAYLEADDAALAAEPPSPTPPAEQVA